jgi:hypothetical protein
MRLEARNGCASSRIAESGAARGARIVGGKMQLVAAPAKEQAIEHESWATI